ncbi:MAG: integrase [Rickettsiales bacterium]|nr:integrase [Rickettsiales bacterium]
MKLNDQTCKHAKPKDKAYKLFDGGGLYLQVNKSGSRLWRLKYYFLNKEKKLSIGEYPIISLSMARDEREKAKKLIAQGIDPSQHKQDIKNDRIEEQNNTFEVIAREWYQMKSSEWSAVNTNTVLGRLEKDVFPVIGSVPIKDITHTMLLDLANTVKQRGASELAKRIIQMSKHIFQFAIITGRAEKNIAEDLKGLVKHESKTHFASIEVHEIPKFLKDLENHKHNLNRQTYLAVKLLMLTFVRTGEMIKAEWQEFDEDNSQWIIPAKRMKMKKDHIVPLSRQAMQVLKEIRQLHNHPKFVFPSRNSHVNHMSNNTILMALNRMGYKGIMTGHGFRSLAMSAIMEKLGYRHEVPDAQLAHAKRGDVNRAYDRAKFLDERVVMMQEWADYLNECGQHGIKIVGKSAKSI